MCLYFHVHICICYEPCAMCMCICYVLCAMSHVPCFMCHVPCDVHVCMCHVPCSSATKAGGDETKVLPRQNHSTDIHLLSSSLSSNLFYTEKTSDMMNCVSHYQCDMQFIQCG